MATQTIQKRIVKTIGKLKDAGKVIIELEIRHNEGTCITVDHKTLNGYTELSLCGTIRTKNGRGYHSGGQIVDRLKDKWRELYITRAELNELINIWETWHLNGLNAGCCHQGKVNNNADYKEWKALQRLETEKCPKGYEYGSKWLVKELPSEVETHIVEILSKLND